MMPVHENLGMPDRAPTSRRGSCSPASARSTGSEPVPGPPGNGPARYFAYPGAAGTIGVISPLSHDYCERCNRVRLTADGRLRLCLFGDQHIDLRSLLRAGAGEEGLADLLRGRHADRAGAPPPQARGAGQPDAGPLGDRRLGRAPRKEFPRRSHAGPKDRCE